MPTDAFRSHRYVDPSGARAEWEGFVAIVNKEQSAKFNTLVDGAPQLIEDLPWGKDYEGASQRPNSPSLSHLVWSLTNPAAPVPEFKRPDFTALEIVSFCTGGIPAGIVRSFPLGEEAKDALWLTTRPCRTSPTVRATISVLDAWDERLT